MMRLSSKIASLILLLAIFLTPLRGFAASYDVSANVPFPAPSIPATIDPSFNNSQQDTETITLFGTCEPIYPTSIISIWNGATLLSSTPCLANSTYSLSISLNVGINTLIAKTSSISNLYGPDSAPTVVTYNPKTPPPAGNSSATTPSSNGGNQSSSQPLTISTESPAVIMNDENKTTIQLKIEGGGGPYTITINWGDGTTETKLISDPGTFTFEHTYAIPNIYKVLATVTDVLGVSKSYQFIVSSGKPQSSNASKKDDDKPAAQKTGNKLWQYGAYTSLMLLLIAIIAVTTFRLGRKYEHDHIAGASKKSHSRGKK